MKHLSMAAAAACDLLAECAVPMAKVSDATSAGSSNYSIRGKPTRTMNWGDIKVETLTEADT